LKYSNRVRARVTLSAAVLTLVTLCGGGSTNAPTSRSAAAHEELVAPLVAPTTLVCPLSAVKGRRIRDGAVVRIAENTPLIAVAVTEGDGVVVHKGALVRVRVRDFTKCEHDSVSERADRPEPVCVEAGEPIAIDARPATTAPTGLVLVATITNTATGERVVSARSPYGRLVALPEAARAVCHSV
jgi:hypothetical protein